MINLKIDGHTVAAREEATILEAALENDIYIPHLCFHPGVGTGREAAARERIYQGEKCITGDASYLHEGCGLCVVEIEGEEAACPSCDRQAADGMVVHTDSDRIREERLLQLLTVFKNHPGTCIRCDLSEGCDRKICSMDVPENARCCWKFNKCELRKIATFIGFDSWSGTTQRVSSEIQANPVFSLDYGLCIGCLRCIVACKDIAQREALGFVKNAEGIHVGMVDSTLKKSGCKYCAVCVEVCPTGALRDIGHSNKKSELRKGLKRATLPPEGKKLFKLNAENIEAVPASAGVYTLFDETHQVVQITGAENLRQALLKEAGDGRAAHFTYEVNEMVMMRERQMIQQHVDIPGELPANNREIDDLF